MATYNVSVTQSIETQPDNVAAGGTMEYVISNPLGVDSYFTLETVPNANGAYDSSSPKNTSGSYTLGSGLRELIKNDYFASVIVSPGGGTLTLIPAVDVTGSTLRLRGVGYTDVTIVPSVDPDAEAFILAAGITDPTQESAINTLVVDLKGYGIWSKMKAIYPFVGGTSTTHKYNLINPLDINAAYRLIFNGGWTHDQNGARPNGVNGYADTFFNLQNFTATNAGTSIYRNLVNNGGADIGTYAGNNFSVYYNAWGPSSGGTVNAIAFSFSGTLSYTGATGLGLYTCNALSGTTKGYENGVIKLTNTTQGNPANVNSQIGRNTYNVEYSDSRYGFIAYHDGLTDTEAANLYTAVQAYQTTLGRQV